MSGSGGRVIRATISIKEFYGREVAKRRYKIHFRPSFSYLRSFPSVASHGNAAGVHKIGNKFSISPLPSIRQIRPKKMEDPFQNTVVGLELKKLK